MTTFSFPQKILQKIKKVQLELPGMHFIYDIYFKNTKKKKTQYTKTDLS